MSQHRIPSEARASWWTVVGMLCAAVGMVALGGGVMGCANSGGGGGGGDQCRGICSTFEACCATAAGGHACALTNTDPNNCGGCGIVCGSGICRNSVCETGTPVDSGGSGFDAGGGGGGCVPECSIGTDCCGGTCVNTEGVPINSAGQSDPSFNNCGFCGNSCDPETASSCSVPAGGSGNPRCLCGIADACAPGFVCGLSGGNYTCVNLQSDDNNCGAVGNVCPGEERCVAGVCSCGSLGSSCGGGLTCCGDSCIDTTSDPLHCGGCDLACSAGSTCSTGQCACADGSICPGPDVVAGTLGGSCCGGTCVMHDANNCGACGNSCADGLGPECGIGMSLVTMELDICCGLGLPGGPFTCTDLGFPGFP